MQAQDKGVPPRKSEMTVEVTVDRDEGVLKFTSQTYTARVSENDNVNKNISKTTAAPGVCFIVVSTFNLIKILYPYKHYSLSYCKQNGLWMTCDYLNKDLQATIKLKKSCLQF